MDQIEAAARGEDSAPLDYDVCVLSSSQNKSLPTVKSHFSMLFLKIPADASTLETTNDDQLSNTLETATDADDTADITDSFMTANDVTAADETEMTVNIFFARELTPMARMCVFLLNW